MTLRWVLVVSWLVFGLVPAGDRLCAEPNARTFFLALDALPYSALAALEEQGSAAELFQELGSPAPLLSTFPSTTSVAMGAALGPLGLAASPGYEARFFDWKRQKVRGGGALSYFRIDFPWRGFFDWSKKSVARSAVTSLYPVSTSERRVLKAFKAFLRSDLQNFFAYVETTDTAAHLRGPSALDEMFRRLGQAIRSARDRGEQFRVVVFSDHGIAGGRPLQNVHRGIVRRLSDGEFRLRKKLREPSSVVLTPFGLVSSFEAYVHAAATPRVAELLASVEGVALCAYRESGRVWLTSGTELALIERRTRQTGVDRGQEWAYRMRAGDPLKYGGTVARLSARATEARGWFSDETWFEATKRLFYPDALRRISQGFELVDNPASIICSVEPDFMYGAKNTERASRLTGSRLAWTHGALHWEASAGFLLTDVSRLEPGRILRISEALEPLVSTAEGVGRPLQRASARQVRARDIRGYR